MGYKIPHHIWRTDDGRLVPHGDPEAAFLAYPAGEELTDHDAEARGVLGVYRDESQAGPSAKSVTEHGDKSVTEHGDKGAVDARETDAGDTSPDPGGDQGPAALEEPKKSGSKADWVEYAVSKGADRAEAEAATRDDLAAAYGSPGK